MTSLAFCLKCVLKCLVFLKKGLLEVNIMFNCSWLLKRFVLPLKTGSKFRFAFKSDGLA